MFVNYRLAESVIVVQGSIEWVKDSISGTDTPAFPTANVDVLLDVRGDEGAGQKRLSMAGGRGDDEFTVEVTTDERLTAVTYKSIGVGSRVVSAGATLVSSIAGLALGLTRFRQTGGRTVTEIQTDLDSLTSDLEDRARQQWEQAHPDEVQHLASYREVAKTATTALLSTRERIVNNADAAEVAAAVVRARRLESVLADAQREVDKVEMLYQAWRATTVQRRTETISFKLSVDTLPAYDDVTGVPDTHTLTGTPKAIWERLGVLVLAAPADGRGAHRPRTAPAVDADSDVNQVQWRVPRPMRLMVFRRGKTQFPELKSSVEAAVVDRFSDIDSMTLHKSVFGEKGGSLTFDGIGAVVKAVRNDKSSLGALADAVGSVPSSVVAGLDHAQKMSTSLTALADVGAERQLALVKRQHDQLAKELDLKGLRATAADFAELKRLTQEVAIATARTGLGHHPH